MLRDLIHSIDKHDISRIDAERAFGTATKVCYQRNPYSGGVGSTTLVVPIIHASGRTLIILHCGVASTTNGDSAWYGITQVPGTQPNAQTFESGGYAAFPGQFGTIDVITSGNPVVVPSGYWLNVAVYDVGILDRTGIVYTTYVEAEA